MKEGMTEMVAPSHDGEPIFIPVSYGDLSPNQVSMVIRLAQKHASTHPRAKDELSNAYRVINGQVVWIRQLEAALLEINTEVHAIRKLLETSATEMKALRAEVSELKGLRTTRRGKK